MKSFLQLLLQMNSVTVENADVVGSSVLVGHSFTWEPHIRQDLQKPYKFANKITDHRTVFVSAPLLVAFDKYTTHGL